MNGRSTRTAIGRGKFELSAERSLIATAVAAISDHFALYTTRTIQCVRYTGSFEVISG
jgi:hypothetical protein